MTKRAVMALGMLALLAAPASAASSIGLIVGYWDTDEADEEVGLGLKLDVDFGRSPVHLAIRGTYFEEFSSAGPVPFHLEVFPFEAGLAYRFREGERVEPYVEAGLGYYVFNISRLAPPFRGAKLDDEAGWYGLVGADFAFHERWSFFAEGMWRNVDAKIEGEGLSDFDILGLELSGFAANVGVSFRF